MPVTRTCIQCGAAFTCAPSRAQQHCSDACARKTQAEKRMLPAKSKTCEICGGTFQYRTTVEKRRFCSDACLFKWRRGRPPGNKLPRIPITCGTCGEVFEVPDSEQGRSRKYCGWDCADRARVGTRPPNYIGVFGLVCRHCNLVYMVPAGKRNSSQFCSRDCHWAYRRTVRGKKHPLYDRIERRCEWCGTTFQTWPGRIASGGGRFCSRNCVGAYTSSLQEGRRSSIELMIEQELRKRKINFAPQRAMGPWTVDFYLPEYALVIECDGDYWHSLPEVQKRDKRKNRWLRKRGIRLCRLGESEIRADPSKALDKALAPVRRIDPRQRDMFSVAQ